MMIGAGYEDGIDAIPAQRSDVQDGARSDVAVHGGQRLSLFNAHYDGN
jgi:hypothetical protein